MRNLYFISIACFILTLGCEKPEKLYPKPQTPIGVQSQTFAMGETYENQVWFDFATQKTETNPFGLWHIAFSCNNKPKIIVNCGINANFSVTSFNNANFSSINLDSIRNAKWRFDNPNGDIDSNAFGNCYKIQNSMLQPQPSIYVIDLGGNLKDSLRYIKLQLLPSTLGQFKWGHGYIQDTAFRMMQTLNADPSRNFIYYNFQTNKSANNEPISKNDWDILFTTYKESIPDANGKPYPYIIRGILSNQNKVEVAQLDNIDFNAVDFSLAKTVAFGSSENVIGYDWKQYDQTSNRYVMVPKRVYLIKTNGNIFKMKFVDFYNDLGKKGYPKLAWELLL